MALRLAAHRSVDGGPCPTSRRHWRGATALAVILALAPAACGGKSAEDYAREACEGLTREDLRPEVDRVEFLREKEQLAATAASEDSRWDGLYDGRRDLRQSTEDRDSKAALEAGLRVVKECRELNTG